MKDIVRVTHTETYTFDNTRQGRKAAEQIVKKYKEQVKEHDPSPYGDPEVNMSTSKVFGCISVTFREHMNVKVDEK